MDKELPILLNETVTTESMDGSTVETERASWFINCVKKKHLDLRGSWSYYKISISIPFQLEFRIQNNKSYVIIDNQEIIDTINLSYFTEGHVNLKRLDNHDKNLLFNHFFKIGDFKYSFNSELGYFIVDHTENNLSSIFQIYQHLIKFTVEILLSNYFQSTRWLQNGTSWG
jgi:hypothetical protein